MCVCEEGLSGFYYCFCSFFSCLVSVNVRKLCGCVFARASYLQACTVRASCGLILFVCLGKARLCVSLSLMLFYKGNNLSTHI